jgi:hypothetical protein
MTDSGVWLGVVMVTNVTWTVQKEKKCEKSALRDCHSGVRTLSKHTNVAAVPTVAWKLRS